MPRRVAVVIGTRPECIKLVPVIEALRRRPSDFEAVVCASGQHREMVAQAFAAFGLRADVELDVPPDQSLSELTASLLISLSDVFRRVEADWVVVQGDTTTAFAAALAAFYQRRRIAHVEAGLRTSDRFNPFPEEMNRKLIAGLADVHFAPTPRASAALRAENVPAERIHVTGNTVVDSLARLRCELATEAGAGRVSQSVRSLTGKGAGIVLVTCHRRESFGEDLAAVCRAGRRIATAHPERPVLFPVHPNPQVCRQVAPLLDGLPNLHLLPPLTYVDLVHVMSHAALVLTDSGGLQEEAPSFGVPLLVLRWKTERPELIECGLAELVGPDEERIVARTSALLACAAPARPGANPYGDGHAGERIADILAALP